MGRVRLHVTCVVVFTLIACGSDHDFAQTIHRIIPNLPNMQSVILENTLFEPQPSPGIKLNHLQMRGTHNSYHVKPRLPLDSSHEYTHRPLYEQFDRLGIHALELDVHLEAGGLATYHISMIDPLSTCFWFSECLNEIRRWSTSNPKHLPIMIWIEVKDLTGGLPITDLDLVDRTILNEFPETKIVMPRDIQNTEATLRAGLNKYGWPEVDSLRGRVMFMMVNNDEHQKEYTYNHTSLDNRVMFVNADLDQFDHPWAVIAKINNPRETHTVQAAHARNMLIASNICTSGESSTTCYEKLSAGWENGVHMLMDDFPTPVTDHVYWQSVPGSHNAWCNPVNAPEACNDARLAPVFVGP